MIMRVVGNLILQSKAMIHLLVKASDSGCLARGNATTFKADSNLDLTSLDLINIESKMFIRECISRIVIARFISKIIESPH